MQQLQWKLYLASEWQEHDDYGKFFLSILEENQSGKPHGAASAFLYLEKAHKVHFPINNA